LLEENVISRKNLCCLCLACMLTAAVGAQTIKLGSLAPEGSPWDKALRRIAADWQIASGGKLRVKVFAGGIAGDEPSMIRKIRINQLQAAAITGVGLGSIVEDFYAVQLPSVIRTPGEMEYVMGELQPTFNRMFEEKGFTLVAWFLAGWAHLFSKTPVATPQEAKRLKLHGDPASPEIIDAWEELGFHVVPVSSTEVLTALQSDLLEAFLLTPLTAAAMQWFGLAKNMMERPLTPMLSGIVVSERVWEGIPEPLKSELLAIVDRHLDILIEETAALEQEALQIMLENGLHINPVSPKDSAEWQRVMGEGLSLVTGTVVSEQMFDRVQLLLDQYRGR
jgi:TRAP-type C4-dicarboxylate transport system substrate-binding protein